MEREGRFGRFVACSSYPKCKYVKKDEKQNSTGVACVVCGKGEMVEKRGRFGPFYACSNYPDCKSTMKARPTGNVCKDCGSLMMEGTKTIPERCSNKQCPNHNPHKLEKK
jgi:DNA topoisomerase-1